MRLTYETGIATMLQLIVLAFLNIANTIVSIVTTCTHPGGSCVSNMLGSIVLYVLLIGWFAFVATLGFAAQSKRSKRLSQALIAAELAVFLAAAVNIKLGIDSHSGALSLFTSFVDMVFSVWIITLAYRLMKAGGARVRRRTVAASHSEPRRDPKL